MISYNIYLCLQGATNYIILLQPQIITKKNLNLCIRYKISFYLTYIYVCLYLFT